MISAETYNADYEKAVKFGYNKGIDEFAEKLKRYMENTEQSNYLDEINKGNCNYSAMPVYDAVDEIAEQLKERE